MSEPAIAPSPEPAPSPAPSSTPGILDPSPTPSPAPSGGWANERGELSDGWVGRIEGLGPEAQAGLTKFKDVPGLAKSYYELQQTMGKMGNRVEIPGADAKPEVFAAYRKALGIPEDITQYQFKPDALPQGVDWNDDVMKRFGEIGHKHNIPPAAMKELAAAQVALTAETNGAMAEQLAGRDKQAREALGKEWGGDFQKNSLRVQAALQLAGQSEDALGDPAKMAITIKRLSDMISDTTLKVGEAAATFGSGEGLATDIITNPNNPDNAAYQDQNHPGHAAVRQKVHDMLNLALKSK